MLNLNDDLAHILSTVRCDGKFYATGIAEMSAPILEVVGVGRISLPVLPVQAAELIAQATRAPFGRGEQTVLDTDVRRTWQIPAEHVSLSGRDWPAKLGVIVARAAEGLGVTVPVSAELYKLLIYDAGSFFVDHRDTEKSEGMFATLVVSLPSACSGGELVVRHRGEEVSLGLGNVEPFDLSFAAFYADCVHEVRPVTQGYRLTLVYNLLRKQAGPVPTLPVYEKEQAALGALLARWVQSKETAAGDTPEKLIYPLEHAYTPAALAFDALKNADAAAAAVLVPAAAATDCDVHLALVAIEERGSAEEIYQPRGRGRWHHGDDDTGSDEDFEIIEVDERTLTVSHWRTSAGAHAQIAPLPFVEEELCPLDCFDDMEPDEQHFQEATGNAGASFERSYQRAALVLWPRTRILAVLNAAGLAVTLPYLADLAERWVRSSGARDSALWRDAHTLSGHMLAGWEDGQHYTRPGDISQAARMLSSLTALGDIERIDAFLSGVSAGGTYGTQDNAALVQAAMLLTPARAGELAERIVARNAHMRAGACANLLARMSENARFAAGSVLLHPAAAALVDTLLGERLNANPVVQWPRPALADASLVADLLLALANSDGAALAERFVGHALSNRETFDADKVLTPAALLLAQRVPARTSAAMTRLRAACQTHLRARIGLPLAPPADFTRAGTVVCRCKHCAELSRFLADPLRGEWVFRAVEAERRHVEDSVTRSGCDLDMETRTQSRPYSLVATKNQASYDRRVVQRKDDLANLAQLDGADSGA